MAGRRVRHHPPDRAHRVPRGVPGDRRGAAARPRRRGGARHGRRRRREDRGERGLEAAGGKPLDAEVLDRAWSELDVTYDPIASALEQSAENGVAAGTTRDEVDLDGIYDLGRSTRSSTTRASTRSRPAASATSDRLTPPVRGVRHEHENSDRWTLRSRSASCGTSPRRRPAAVRVRGCLAGLRARPSARARRRRPRRRRGRVRLPASAPPAAASRRCSTWSPGSPSRRRGGSRSPPSGRR